MKGIRIEVVATLGDRGIRPLYAIDVTCDCGRNGLADETGIASFGHRIAPNCHGDQSGDKMLICPCGKKYVLHPQNGHIHILDA